MKIAPNPDSMDYLLAQVSHLHHFAAHQRLDALGLYRGQPPLLQSLWEQDGQTQTELARQLQDTPATVTKMLQRMEKAGFIQRRPDEADQRITRVYLTQAGKDVRNALENVLNGLETAVFKGFDQPELECLRGYLLRLRANLLELQQEQ
ncbi:MAG TPA: MarR family transcriptional regulator [Anaerolineales bacterium]|nr:MarR family transcriptional regulator [Anaerolineales bacterium]